MHDKLRRVPEVEFAGVGSVGGGVEEDFFQGGRSVHDPHQRLERNRHTSRHVSSYGTGRDKLLRHVTRTKRSHPNRWLDAALVVLDVPPERSGDARAVGSDLVAGARCLEMKRR